MTTAQEGATHLTQLQTIKRASAAGANIIDGSPQGRTAYFTTPYLTGGPGGEKRWTGQLLASQDVINQGLEKVYGLGLPVLFHANGGDETDSEDFDARVFAEPVDQVTLDGEASLDLELPARRWRIMVLDR